MIRFVSEDTKRRLNWKSEDPQGKINVKAWNHSEEEKNECDIEAHSSRGVRTNKTRTTDGPRSLDLV